MALVHTSLCMGYAYNHVGEQCIQGFCVGMVHCMHAPSVCVCVCVCVCHGSDAMYQCHGSQLCARFDTFSLHKPA